MATWAVEPDGGLTAKERVWGELCFDVQSTKETRNGSVAGSALKP